MEKIFEAAKNNPLFSGIAFDNFKHLLNCLQAKKAFYKKENIILYSGDNIDFIGLVISGSVQVIKQNRDGKTTLLTILGASEMFAEVFACAAITQSPVTVEACEDTEILFMNYKKIITTCNAACPFHARLIKNMLQLLAQKSLMLNQKIEILSRRTTREKLLYFFDLQRGAAKKFTINLNRDELSAFLCVDRSAMSNELCKMRDAGLIRFQKNNFEIL